MLVACLKGSDRRESSAMAATFRPCALEDSQAELVRIDREGVPFL